MDELPKRSKNCESIESRNFTHTLKRISAPDVESKCELTLPDDVRELSVFSLPAHTHTLEGLANTGEGAKCKTKCDGSLTLQGGSIQPGALITWNYGGPARVEFIHMDENGVTWAYVSWPGYQTAVNVNALTKIESI
jgi:hypothetical protein